MITYAPNTIVLNALPTVFLAGSIEMGTAENWQSRIGPMISRELGCHVLDPRRLDWDPSWEQTADNLQFAEQVVWETLGLDVADYVIFNILPDTKSPITLLELGYVLGSRGGNAMNQVVVNCPPGFWRKGNVDIMCNRADVEVTVNEEHMLDWLTYLLKRDLR